MTNHDETMTVNHDEPPRTMTNHHEVSFKMRFDTEIVGHIIFS